jgi:plastocyanin
MLIIRAGLATAVLALMAGCNSSTSTTPTVPTPTPATANVSIPMGARTLGANSYAPNPVTISAGTTVSWMNTDTIAHTSTADGGSFNTGTIAAGQHVEVMFNTAGSFPYHCAFHPGMVGTVVVH